MKSIYCTISLFFYAVFTYFFWIAHDPKSSGIVICSFAVCSYFLSELRNGLVLLSLVSVTHLVYWLSFPSMFFQWPFDFFIMAGTGFLLLRLFDRDTPLIWSVPLTKSQFLSALIINIPSVFILDWYFEANKEVAQHWPFPELPIWFTPFFILLIAAINGLREEIYYRGILQSQSYRNFPSWFCVAFQAIMFGGLHYTNAFPQGWIGVSLTGLWGGAIAIQYHVFRSIKLAWITHATADAIMFTIIIMSR